MQVVVVLSDVGADPAPDDLDTLTAADAIAAALGRQGHEVRLAPFSVNPVELRRTLEGADLVFNMVEMVFGEDNLACLAPSLFEALSVSYTGSPAAPLALAADKPLAKRVLRASGLPTPDWSEPPAWAGLEDHRTYIVKSATEDASLGLDDGSVVRGRDRVLARASGAEERYGGRWFAEAYVEGREFNVALLEAAGVLRVLPIPEMRFDAWPSGKPRIVGYGAKWDEASEDAVKTIRTFGLERETPALAQALADLARDAARLFGIRGYARIDFRVDEAGNPFLLEINPNPCIAPDAGFAAAAAQAGIAYDAMIGSIVEAALGRR